MSYLIKLDYKHKRILTKLKKNIFLNIYYNENKVPFRYIFLII